MGNALSPNVAQVVNVQRANRGGICCVRVLRLPGGLSHRDFCGGLDLSNMGFRRFYRRVDQSADYGAPGQKESINFGEAVIDGYAAGLRDGPV